MGFGCCLFVFVTFVVDLMSVIKNGVECDGLEV
jgi:hypothetical protein